MWNPSAVVIKENDIGISFKKRKHRKDVPKVLNRDMTTFTVIPNYCMI